MTSLSERRVGAVVGALVADAAVQPLHWIYDKGKLDALIQNADEIGFWTPSANPFYNIENGLHSCYGDQSFVILKSLVECRGVDVQHLKKSTFDWFGPNSDYEKAVQYFGTKENKASTNKLPIQGPWRHASIKHFLKNYDSGLDDTGSETDEQIDSVLRVVPVVALYAGRPEMLEKVEAVLRVTQNFDTAVVIGLTAARILEQYILHGHIPSCVDEVITQLQNPDRHNPQDLDRAVIGFINKVLDCLDKPHDEVVSGIFRKD